MTTEGRDPTELARLRQEIEILRAERQQFLEQLQQKSREIDSLQHQLQQLLRRLFGRSAEKLDPKQLVLFEALLNQLAPPTSDAPSASAPAPRPATNSTPSCPTAGTLTWSLHPLQTEPATRSPSLPRPYAADPNLHFTGRTRFLRRRNKGRSWMWVSVRRMPSCGGTVRILTGVRGCHPAFK